MSNKIQCFEYILYQLISWYKELRPTDVSLLSFTRLKVLKLLFFVSVIRQEDEPDLLDIFNNFYAMQYGPVESDVYNAIQANMLPSYIAEYRSIERRKECIDFPSEYKGPEYEPIQNAVKELRTKNENLIELNAFELVEITHKWNSWNLAMNFAEFMGQLSAKMSTVSIEEDSNKRFSLTD